MPPMTSRLSLRLALAGAALLAVLGARPALAQGQDHGCWGIRPGDEALEAATVGPAAPRLFFRARPTGAAEPGRAFLMPGDVVVVSRRQGGFACASYLNDRRRLTAGWLPAAALQPLAPPTTAPLEAWQASWYGTQAYEQEIDISAEGSTLRIGGSASWGSDDPARVERGGVNIGSLEAEVRPSGARLGFSSDGGERTRAYDEGGPETCRVRMLLLGPYLVVQDNLRCGGMNVTFSGLYRRAG
ncbi:hypothetical protein BKE38_14160 [Pseudoroseomonas deserti]|uniref:SH3b domain-containing protein n=1 Tax=Teichococcus deserti TaxID=1817963 RepID=A0A1V2H350_9PROT|nr:hypothetical protein [Pseudoroseomonas deserti]ONG52603.1 hypothetical protein BKE38_14160 [Pseudoroseomonas deserti]